MSNKMFFLILLFICCQLLLASAVYSLPINYSFNSNIVSTPVTDPLDLDGGTFDLHFSLDSSSLPDSIDTSFPDTLLGYYYNVVSNLHLAKSDGTTIFDSAINGRFRIEDYFGTETQGDGIIWSAENVNISNYIYSIGVTAAFQNTFIDSVAPFSFNNSDIVWGFTDISGDDNGGFYVDDLLNPGSASGAPVPEPSTMFLFSVCILSLAGILRNNQPLKAG